ncbi:MAG: homoserine O-acetyltransferase [Chloroflexota bacterium]|nr:homoserine O-acetyltransferase [Chloroflexota bacterium]
MALRTDVVVGAPGSAGIFRTQYLDLPDSLMLDCGRGLDQVRIGYETYGRLSPSRDNVVLVCHALSGDQHAAGWSANPRTPSAVDGFRADERGIAPRGGLGWWDGMIGPGKAFDTDRYFVVCTNLIGSCRGSTGPGSPDPRTGKPYGLDFPVVTVADMVRAQERFLTLLGIDSLLAVGGGSLGGMQALEWAVAFPEKVRACIPIASTARLGDQGMAWNAIARSAIMADPNWQGGYYYGTGQAPLAGIGVARMVGHVTYLSAESMHAKFNRRLQDREHYSFTLTEPDFAVESYLRHQADAFADRFDANSYLYISRALTYFDLARDRGAGSLERAMADVSARSLLISFSSDWLYPPADSQALESALRANNKQVEHHLIDASYGHDSFLLEEARQASIIAAFLEEVANTSHA